ncbi:MAG TPA: hypothetical protein VJR89_32110, partial [Polyangiales bacterium]|nr:hypothetical protein [Polyangiales bacterium]
MSTTVPSAGRSAGAGASGTAAPAAGSGGAVVAGAQAQAGASGAAATAGAGTAGAAGGTAGAAGGTAGAAGGAPPAAELMGCGDSKLLALPEDETARGPWPVGQKTVKIGRLEKVEIMYPAKPGSETGKEALKVDMRVFLPQGEASKVPDAEATIISQDTYSDLPLDDAHGPYPIAVFVHGTASFRVGSWSTQALWASRGIVVVAADHPGLYLGDYLAQQCGRTTATENLSADVDAELAALAAPSGDLAFLANHIDPMRVAIAGHSAGAYAAATFSTKPGVQLIMPLSGTRATTRAASLKSVLYVSGIADSVLPYKPGGFGVGSILYPGNATDAYDDSPGPPDVKKRLVGITGGGHLV